MRPEQAQPLEVAPAAPAAQAAPENAGATRLEAPDLGHRQAEAPRELGWHRGRGAAR